MAEEGEVEIDKETYEIIQKHKIDVVEAVREHIARVKKCKGKYC